MLDTVKCDSGSLLTQRLPESCKFTPSLSEMSSSKSEESSLVKDGQSKSSNVDSSPLMTSLPKPAMGKAEALQREILRQRQQDGGAAVKANQQLNNSGNFTSNAVAKKSTCPGKTAQLQAELLKEKRKEQAEKESSKENTCNGSNDKSETNSDKSDSDSVKDESSNVDKICILDSDEEDMQRVMDNVQSDLEIKKLKKSGATKSENNSISAPMNDSWKNFRNNGVKSDKQLNSTNKNSDTKLNVNGDAKLNSSVNGTKCSEEKGNLSKVDASNVDKNSVNNLSDKKTTEEKESEKPESVSEKEDKTPNISEKLFSSSSSNSPDIGIPSDMQVLDEIGFSSPEITPITVAKVHIDAPFREKVEETLKKDLSAINHISSNLASSLKAELDNIKRQHEGEDAASDVKRKKVTDDEAMEISSKEDVKNEIKDEKATLKQEIMIVDKDITETSNLKRLLEEKKPQIQNSTIKKITEENNNLELTDVKKVDLDSFKTELKSEKENKKLTKSMLKILARKFLQEHISDDDKSEYEKLKMKYEQLEKAADKWRKKANIYQKQVTELQIVLQRLSQNKKYPYAMKPPMRSVGLQVQPPRNGVHQIGNPGAVQNQRIVNQVGLQQQQVVNSASTTSSVTIRPIDPTGGSVTNSIIPPKPMMPTKVTSNPVTVSILQPRGSSNLTSGIIMNRSMAPTGQNTNTLNPRIPNLSVTQLQTTQQQKLVRPIETRLIQTPNSPVTMAANSPVPMRLIQNQAVTRQNVTGVTTTPNNMLTTLAPQSTPVTILTQSPTTSSGQLLTFGQAVGPGGSVQVPYSSPGTTVRVASPIRPQQLINSQGIPSGARVAYLVPSSVTVVRPQQNTVYVPHQAPQPRLTSPTTLVGPLVLQKGTTIVPVSTGTGHQTQSINRTSNTSFVPSSLVTNSPTSITIKPTGSTTTSMSVGPPPNVTVGSMTNMSSAGTSNVSVTQTNTNSIISKISPPRAPAPASVQPVPTQQWHPAPLPPPINQDLSKPLPSRPTLKVSKVNNGIVLSWNMPAGTVSPVDILSYQLYAYQEVTSAPSTALWKKVGDVKALPLPMACTLTQFVEGHKYHFAVRGVGAENRIGPFSEPGSIDLPTT